MNEDDLERAKIALEEYRTLRTEILQRNTILIQIAAGGMAAIVALIGFGAAAHLQPWSIVGLIALVFACMGLTWRAVHADTVRAATRIVEIEKYVNACVGGDSVNPLSWETRFGIGPSGTIKYVDRLLAKRPET